MAEIPCKKFSESPKVYLWEGISEDSVGEALECDQFVPESVQVCGDFGAAGSVVIEGTLGGGVWETLEEPTGFPLSFSSNSSIKSVGTRPASLRPRAVNGAGMNVNVYLLVRR